MSKNQTTQEPHFQKLQRGGVEEQQYYVSLINTLGLPIEQKNETAWIWECYVLSLIVLTFHICDIANQNGTYQVPLWRIFALRRKNILNDDKNALKVL